jgi:hypothetical protein
MALIQAAQNSPDTITIKPDYSGGGPGTGEGPNPNIGMDPDNPNGIGPKSPIMNPPPGVPPTAPEEIPPNDLIGCAVVLGHELGHAATGEEDERSLEKGGEWTGGTNVGSNENPIRRHFGLPPREHYHGYPIAL